MTEATHAAATDIDGVIAELETIIQNAQREGDRLGYFAALYHKVTCKVRDDIAENLFEDGSLLADLDVVFANRYLFAYYEWKRDKSSKRLSESWKVAFRGAENSTALVLQQLLLGMNAHINFDLGIAVVELAQKGNDLKELKKDYLAINNILAALTYGIISKLNIVSPFLSLLGFTGTQSNSMLVQFSLSNARDGAWVFALDLSDLVSDQPKYDAFVAKRDAEISALGQLLVTSKGFLKFGIFVIWLFEWKKADRIIDVLHTHRKLAFKQIIRSFS